MQVHDSFDRRIDYVRIAVTDRCNLRCFYCMPEEGIAYEPKSHLLSYEEITRLLKVLGNLGFSKVRFTGGEPFLRKDFIQLLENTANLQLFKNIHITTNGTLIKNQIPKMKSLGISKINLSLDTLDAERFKKITRRSDFEKVMKTFNQLVEEGFQVKVNAVVMQGVNVMDILPLAQLAADYPVSIRYIEEMPFNGGYKENQKICTAKDIQQTLQSAYPSLQPMVGKHGDTATEYQVEGFKGTLGIIPAFSRTFCNTCNRLRITAKGEIKTCLYDSGVFSIRDFIRSGVTDDQLTEKIIALIKLKPKDGFAAEEGSKLRITRSESMSSIGG